MRDRCLAKHVVQREYCESRHVEKCLLKAAQRHAEGKKVFLGDLLVKKGYLSPHQLEALLDPGSCRLLYCKGCEKAFQVFGFQRGHRLRCVECRSILAACPREFDLWTAEEIFFDQELAEDVRRFGKTAVRHEFLSEKQIARAFSVQEALSKARSLGEILLDLEYLDTKQLNELLEIQEREEVKRRAKRDERCRTAQIGEVAVKLGLASEEMIAEALAAQEEEIAETGKRRRLGMILLEKGILTRAQIARILARKGQVADVEVAGDLVIGDGQLAVLEVDQAEEAPAPAIDDDVETTRRKFTRFYEREGIDLGDTGADEVRSGRMPAESRRREARVEESRRIQKRARMLPVVAAGVLLAFGLVSLAGHLLTRSEPAPPVDPAAPLMASEPEAVLVAGNHVVALGNVPPGATVERSGTVLFLHDGLQFKIDDPSGRHVDVLARIAERRADPRARVLLRVRGVLRPVPEGRSLPADVHPALSIEVESIEEIRGDEMSGSRRLEIDSAGQEGEEKR